MAERILNLVCPKCKGGIKHDTLTGKTVSIAVSEYPEVNEFGRCWCKTCQHGTYPNEDGLCMECLDKHRFTRLQPEPVKTTVVKDKVEDTIENIIEKSELKEDDASKTITLKKTVPNQRQSKPTKTVIGNTNKK